MIKPMPQSVPTTIKAVVFDFDGTIADSFPIFVHGVEYALNRKPFTPEEVENLRQYSAQDVVKILKIRMWKWPFLAVKCTREIDRHQDDIALFKGVPEALHELSQQGYKLYIVSSHSRKSMGSILARQRLLETFDHIYGNVGLFGKPRHLKKILSRFHYSSSECLFVGDEIRDIEAAKKAGMRCVAVTWGFNTAKSLRAHNPTSVIDGPSELVQVLKNLSR